MCSEKNFIKELYDLMAKHNVNYICWTCSGVVDFGGIYDEQMVINFIDNNKSNIIIDGNSIQLDNLKELLDRK